MNNDNIRRQAMCDLLRDRIDATGCSVSALLDAAKVWLDLAAQEIRMAEIDARYGDTTSHKKRAEIYMSCAKALEIQHETGVAVCSCCHKPLGEGMKQGEHENY